MNVKFLGWDMNTLLISPVSKPGFYTLRQKTQNLKPGDLIDIELEKADEDGTTQQNKFFHSLVTAFFVSGASSYDTWDEIKIAWKKAGGAKVKVIKIDGENYMYVQSWSAMGKRARMKAIDYALNEMAEAGVTIQEYIGEYDGLLHNGKNGTNS